MNANTDNTLHWTPQNNSLQSKIHSYLLDSTMRSLAILVLALCLYECRAMTFETVDNDNSKCVAPQNTTSKYDSCVSSYYNQELNVDNVHEFKLDMEEILKVRADYEKDVRPYLHTGKSTKDFCLTTPYDANRKVSKSSFINAVQSITTI